MSWESCVSGFTAISHIPCCVVFRIIFSVLLATCSFKSWESFFFYMRIGIYCYKVIPCCVVFASFFKDGCKFRAVLLHAIIFRCKSLKQNSCWLSVSRKINCIINKGVGMYKNRLNLMHVL